MSLFTFPVISNRPKTWSNLVSTPTVHCFSLLLVTFWTPTWRSGLGLPSLNISYDIASLPASSNIFGYHWYTKSSCCSLPRTVKKIQTYSLLFLHMLRERLSWSIGLCPAWALRCSHSSSGTFCRFETPIRSWGSNRIVNFRFMIS